MLTRDLFAVANLLVKLDLSFATFVDSDFSLLVHLLLLSEKSKCTVENENNPMLIMTSGNVKEDKVR